MSGIDFLRSIFLASPPRPKRAPNPPKAGLRKWLVFCRAGRPLEVAAATKSEARAAAKRLTLAALPPGTVVRPKGRAA